MGYGRWIHGKWNMNNACPAVAKCRWGRWVIVILNLTILMAQPEFPGTPNQAPIGGLAVLAIAGGALALKKLWKKRKGK